jgi:hypothetical protein
MNSRSFRVVPYLEEIDTRVKINNQNSYTSCTLPRRDWHEASERPQPSSPSLIAASCTLPRRDWHMIQGIFCSINKGNLITRVVPYLEEIDTPRTQDKCILQHLGAFLSCTLPRRDWHISSSETLTFFAIGCTLPRRDWHTPPCWWVVAEIDELYLT